jgi:cell division protein FtsI (penicillin-binding protein 3)
VYLGGEFRRSYPAGPLARAVIGALSADSGRGASGLELALDSVLTGVAGEAVVLKDTRGRVYVSPSRLEREPVAGRDVYLTIDGELQEIAERALEEAIINYEAQGGDVVMVDPRTGEILAAASRRREAGRMVVNRASFFTDPFEPGSTAKLFTAGALLALGRVSPEDRVYAEKGLWKMAVNSRGDVRSIHDEHELEYVTLGETIKYSSNIGMGKFAERLSPAEQFDMLRGFGFGSPSGVEFPSETPGILKLPGQWDAYSKTSVAMGYAFGVTPMQLAAAYAAIANDGILLTPSLVREVRDPDGRVSYRHQPEPVRRAVPPEVAAQLRGYLRLVVGDGGTAESAQLANYPIAGKTGTARRYDGGQYQAGHFTASFASIWPADDPQLAVVVKIDDPRGAQYYGGTTAAPTTRAMLEEALAARRSAIDRGRLVGPAPLAEPVDLPRAEPTATRRAVFPLPFAADTGARPGRRAVPNVAGGSMRKAANTLHRRGFKVAVRGSGTVRRTTPAMGDSVDLGQVITIWGE